MDESLNLGNIARDLSKLQEDTSKIPVYWKERIGDYENPEMINRLVCFATKGDIERFMYGKWIMSKHMIARNMAEHVLFYEIDGVEFLLEANSSFAEKQKSLGQKYRDF